MDLAEAVEFDLSMAETNIERVRPGMAVMKVSTKNGTGMTEWLQYLATAWREHHPISSSII
jgi:Ni2+-binding GTPase involved in maturation of urease and hydrogenase